MNDVYIRKNDVLKILKALYKNRPFADVRTTMGVAIKNVEELSILELVECRNCKHYDVYICTVTGEHTHYDDWCCYGEKVE